MLNELPPALRALEAGYDRVQGTAILSEKQTSLVTGYDVAFWIDGNRSRCDRTWRSDFAGQKKGHQLVSVSTPQRAFVLARGPEDREFRVKYVGVNGQDPDADVSYYARKFLGTVYGFEKPLSQMMAEPSFAFQNVRADGSSRVKADFSYNPADRAGPFLGPMGVVTRVDGWVVLAPDLGWAVQEIQMRATTEKGQQATRSGRVEYDGIRDGLPIIRRVVHNWKTDGKAPAVLSFEVQTISRNATPDKPFTLAAFGLGSLELPPDASPYRVAFWAAGLAVLALALTVWLTWRQRSERLASP
jgi:hypothetical protein